MTSVAVSHFRWHPHAFLMIYVTLGNAHLSSSPPAPLQGPASLCGGLFSVHLIGRGETKAETHLNLNWFSVSLLLRLSQNSG